MAIYGKTFRPMDSGTVYGVPYQYSMERDEYVLPDGSKFHNENELIGYVQRNLKSLEQVLAQKNKYVPLSDPRPTPEELNQRRLFIVTENKRRQLKWDKEFNRKVLDLVNTAIDRGGVAVLRVAKVKPFTIESYGESSTVAVPDYEAFEIHYDSHLPEIEAYARCREQAEGAVKKTLPPPDLLPMI